MGACINQLSTKHLLVIFFLVSFSVNADEMNVFQGFQSLTTRERVENKKQIQERNGLMYFVNELSPFSGKVVEKVKDCVENKESFKNGLKNGEQVYYYLDSCGKSPERILQYVNNSFFGKQTIYYDNGQVRLEINLRKNSINIERFYKNGQLETAFSLDYTNVEHLSINDLIEEEIKLIKNSYDPADPFKYYIRFSPFRYEQKLKSFSLRSYYPDGKKSSKLIFEDGKIVEDYIYNYRGDFITSFKQREINAIRYNEKIKDEKIKREKIANENSKKAKEKIAKAEKKKKEEEALKRKKSKDDKKKELTEKILYLTRLEKASFFYTEKKGEYGKKEDIILSDYDRKSLTFLPELGFIKNVGKGIFRSYGECSNSDLKNIIERKVPGTALNEIVLSYYKRKCVRATCLLNCKEYGKIETILDYNLSSDAVRLMIDVVQNSNLFECKKFITDQSILNLELTLNNSGKIKNLATNSRNAELDKCLRTKLLNQTYAYLGIEKYRIPIVF